VVHHHHRYRVVDVIVVVDADVDVDVAVDVAVDVDVDVGVVVVVDRMVDLADGAVGELAAIPIYSDEVESNSYSSVPHRYSTILHHNTHKSTYHPHP